MKRDKPRSGKKWLRAAIPLTVLAGIYLSGVPYTVDERTQAGLYFLGKQPVGMVVGSFVAGKPDSSRLNPVVKWNERMKKIFNKDDEKVVATKTDSSSIDDLTEVAADSLVKTSPFIVDRSPIKPVKIEQGAGLKFKWMSHLVKVKKFSDQNIKMVYS